MSLNTLHNQKFRPAGYRSEIDGLRALAALAVLLFHFFPEMLPSGYLGVDLFFVISGYVITNFLVIDMEDKSFKFSNFYERRVKRILPLTFVVTTVTLIASYFIQLQPDFKISSLSAISTSTFWANIYFWRDGGYFGGADKLKPLLHMWSLAVEEQFYIFFPALLWALITRCGLSVIALIGALSALAIGSFVAFIALNHLGGSSPAFFLMPTRIWQFGIGAIVALLVGYELSNKSVAWSAIALLFVLLFLWLPGFSIISQIGVAIGTGIYLLKGGSGNVTDKLLSFPTMKYIGLRSFSIYLWHWPIVAFLNYIFIEDVALGWKIAGLVLTFVIAEFSFRLIEKPFRYTYQLKTSFWLIGASSIAMISVFLVALGREENGLPDRMAEQVQTNFRCNISDFVPYGASRACILKVGGSNGNVAIIGNSHAQMYAPAVLDKYEKTTKSVTLIPINSCIPTPELNVSVVCAKSARTNLNALLSDKKIGIVYIGTTYDHKNLFLADGTEVIDQDGLLLATELVKLVDIIESDGKEVRLIGPITVPGFDFSSEMSRRMRFGWLAEEDARKLFFVPYHVHRKKFHKITNALSNRLGPALIRPDKFLCDSVVCRFADNNSSYFADGSHLGRYGVSVVNAAFINND